MNVSLTRELEAFVAEKVRSGRYGSASEVVRAALRLLEEWDRDHPLRLKALKAHIAKGIDQLDRGEGIPGDVVLRDLAKRAKPSRGRPHRR